MRGGILHWPVPGLGYQCRAAAPDSILLLFPVTWLKDAPSSFTNSLFSGVSMRGDGPGPSGGGCRPAWLCQILLS